MGRYREYGRTYGTKSEPGKINVSHTTSSQVVCDTFKCTYRDEIEANDKGKLKMYFVEG